MVCQLVTLARCLFALQSPDGLAAEFVHLIWHALRGWLRFGICYLINS